MNYTAILFWVLAFMTGGSAVLVVVTQNIVRSATWLLFTLAGTSGIFFLLGADFVGATQLLVYVGGTLVLVVFGVMLTAQGPFVNLKAGPAEWAVAALAGFLLFSVLSAAVASWPTRTQPGIVNTANSNSSVLLGESFLGINEAMAPAPMTGLIQAPGKTAVPSRQQVAYLLPFEIISVHLLVVLIGAAYLARAKRRRGVPG
jgi:NADH:ubiquinone oxidoreductase subunit 6 (subunit J)